MFDKEHEIIRANFGYYLVEVVLSLGVQTDNETRLTNRTAYLTEAALSLGILDFRPDEHLMNIHKWLSLMTSSTSDFEIFEV